MRYRLWMCPNLVCHNHRHGLKLKMKKWKLLQNKSSRFVLGLAMTYLCVCVSVCVEFCGFQRIDKFC